ncbi:ABC transporter permease subunit [Methyloligella sp. 2.7D]|uniref:ABC transporter permease n=1 Tax=unclassified Methyloligella TaxID=2625955 RepID=UPI00157C79C3|nr:ABC transporter permease subunit [Methyloligella sp. GL2]QKP77918.1 ABC transporter permease subunit [Methyloligella sp. GL2]
MRRWSAGSLSFALFSLVFLLTPLVLVVLFSFGENPHATLPFGHPTLHWYEELFANSNFWAALKNSAIITLSVGVLSAITGTAAAFGFSNMREGPAQIGLQFITAPVMLPPLFLALALATAYAAIDAPQGVLTVIPSHLVFTQPFVVLVIYSRMATFDYALIESARDLGASPLSIFLNVTLPIIAPNLIGASFLAMAVSLDDFVITFFTIGGGMTLPTLIWGMLRTSLDPSINALGTLVLVMTVGSSIIAFKTTRYRG